MPTTGQRIGYIRVSSEDQNPDRQLEGVAVDRTFIERASGKDVERPQLQALVQYARDGDTVIIHSMDRLARNIDDLLRLVREFTSQGITVEFRSENLRFTGQDSPMSQLMLTVLGAVAQFERDLIRERQREGIALAKQRGVYRGRNRKLSNEQIPEQTRRAAAGESKAALAREYGISRETLYQYLVAELLLERGPLSFRDLSRVLQEPQEKAIRDDLPCSESQIRLTIQRLEKKWGDFWGIPIRLLDRSGTSKGGLSEEMGYRYFRQSQKYLERLWIVRGKQT